ncbi:heparan-alpha-glucosaminide N-acetyltransferase domain-containing protein [Sphingobacterium sp. UT-1RO-CII-1]|uniref:acyltransferase family protein n=1 Tax=Sphingobacterium sp. UT-1RO-CII-1 TaxID=2995225 RepID=UPI00227B3FCA|nr:heparan-alpha-glucosaminide N-acetyltransferase domain-containing protein [Sphingobacterium sp. UT-1RO-CII-1]MCY4780850.1 heparan-alpha-glucosaminide N-acetyltransferase domain-containing protein [Sphingobacterium sp. UT-1RO-CII-1]
MTTQPKNTMRIVSLDVMRGLIMLLLAAESTRLYRHLYNGFPDGLAHEIVKQFTHHKWHGLYFWDLVQPAFMLIAGSAMYISYSSKLQKGITWEKNLKHILSRCLKLFIAGVALHCIYSGKLVFELWNVLTQLAFTTLIAYLIIQWKPSVQIAFSLALLILTELLYRYTNIPGFDQAFINQHNFGNYVDLKIMGVINSGGWVAINIIPTAAHTIWGSLAGRLLIANKTQLKKIYYLALYGVVLLIAGYTLDLSNITPIIKRISTSSFVLVSGGYVLLIMAMLSYIVDVKKQSKYSWVLTVIGMNAIFIYLFFETVGKQWFNQTIEIFIAGGLSFVGISGLLSQLIVSITTLFALWYLCYWLYKRKIFFKI